jgi:hypothetical protein
VVKSPANSPLSGRIGRDPLAKATGGWGRRAEVVPAPSNVRPAPSPTPLPGERAFRAANLNRHDRLHDHYVHGMFLLARGQARFSDNAWWSLFSRKREQGGEVHCFDHNSFVYRRTGGGCIMQRPPSARFADSVNSPGIPPSLMTSAATGPRLDRRGPFYRNEGPLLSEQAGRSGVGEISQREDPSIWLRSGAGTCACHSFPAP